MSDENKKTEQKPDVKREIDSTNKLERVQLNKHEESKVKKGIDFEAKPTPPKEKPKTDSK
jgi:hypothetical protein